MNKQMKVFGILLACLIGTTVCAQTAVPPAVEKVAQLMKSKGIELKAAYTKKLGVFIVAKGEAEITGSKANAKVVARAEAVKKMAGFFGSDVSASDRVEMMQSSVNDQTEIKEFFSSITEVKIKQLLKGVQDCWVEDEGDKIVYTVYLTTRGADKTAELRAAMNAMGDEGTVRAVGEAKTRQNAVQMALRSAVEQVVGTMVVGETKISSSKLMRNKIFAGAEGFVDTYRIVEETEISIGWKVAVLAKVSKKKLLDSYRTYLKVLGDPVFYLDCTSSDSDGEDKQVAARFGQFFRKLGLKVSKTPEGADYCINAYGEYRRVTSPIDPDQVYTQYSMIIKILSKTGEELLSLPNNPRKSSVCINNPEREREMCVAKAFKQMEKPVHEAINAMIARMMADHTDKLINDN